jgi:ribosome-associated protein
MLQTCKNNINQEGELVISSELHREQERNLDECYKKLKILIFQDSIIHKERRHDIPPETENQKEKRINEKRWRSEIKQNRRNGGEGGSL